MGVAWQAEDIASVNKSVDRAIGLFSHFIRCYKDARCVSPLVVVARLRPSIPTEPLSGASTLDNESRCVHDDGPRTTEHSYRRIYVWVVVLVALTYSVSFLIFCWQRSILDGPLFSGSAAVQNHLNAASRPSSRLEGEVGCTLCCHT